MGIPPASFDTRVYVSGDSWRIRTGAWGLDPQGPYDSASAIGMPFSGDGGIAATLGGVSVPAGQVGIALRAGMAGSAGEYAAVLGGDGLLRVIARPDVGWVNATTLATVTISAPVRVAVLRAGTTYTTYVQGSGGS